MKVSVDKMPGSVVDIDIASDPDEFATEVEKTFRDVSKQASIPGFRKGKAPRHIIERMIGREAIVAEAGRNMMDDLYRRALDEQELQPIAEPMVDIYNEDPLAFRVVVEVFPTVELGDYRSVRAETQEVELEDDDVDDEVQALRRNRAEWNPIPIERAPKDGDKVILDLDVFDGDALFQDPGRDAEFILGETNMFEPLVEAIKLMQPGTSSELTLAFEEDDETVREPLRGKTLRYEITLKEIQTANLPEIDDEFVAEVGEFESVDEFLQEVEKSVLRNKAQNARNEVVNSIISDILDISEVAVPASMVSGELDDEIQQLRSRLAQQGLNFEEYLMSLNQTEDDMREEMFPQAEDRVRRTLVLQEIAKAENLEITDEDIDAEIEKLVGDSENAEQMRQLYRSDYFRGMLENEINDRKLIELVVDIGTEGRGAISGAGADLLEADAASPPAQSADVTETEDAADESDDLDVAESISEQPDAEANAADADASEPEASAAADEADKVAVAADEDESKPE